MAVTSLATYLSLYTLRADMVPLARIRVDGILGAPFIGMQFQRKNVIDAHSEGLSVH